MSSSLDKVAMYIKKKAKNDETNNKKIGPTLDPLVSPLMMLQSSAVTVIEIGVHTIKPIIEKNNYIHSSVGMCVDIYLRVALMLMFIVSFVENCISPSNKELLASSINSNKSKLGTVWLCLVDMLYKTREKEIEAFLKEQALAEPVPAESVPAEQEQSEQEQSEQEQSEQDK
jgi:hypothetical protein